MKLVPFSTVIPLVIFAFLSFGLGHLITEKNLKASTLEVEHQEPKPEISVIVLERVEGDQLHLEVSGPGRVVWGSTNFIEGDGWHQIPLGQIPDENDLAFKNFAYTGNAKTKKFYPSHTYPARGTAVKHRRFFQTKQAALEAGFIASKLVK